MVCQPLVTSYVIDAAYLCLAMLHAWTLEYQHMILLCIYLRCGDLRSPGATELRNGSLGQRDDDDDDEG